jgi:hypothetical protein
MIATVSAARTPLCRSTCPCPPATPLSTYPPTQHRFPTPPHPTPPSTPPPHPTPATQPQRSEGPSDPSLLKRAFDIIDEANSADPQKVEGQPYRLVYGRWLSEWVKKLDPGASDELLLLARGKNIEGWKLSNIKRDDYAPNVGGEWVYWTAWEGGWLHGRIIPSDPLNPLCADC